MNETNEFWRDVKEADRKRKERNRAAADPEGWTQHTGYHWSRLLDGDRLDYWPSTGRFRWRGRTYSGGVTGFINKRERYNVTPKEPTDG